MKSLLFKSVKWIAIGFGVLVGLGMLISVVDPEGVKRRQAEREARQPKPTAEVKTVQKTEQRSDPVFDHGFAVGFTSAKSGAVKPTADELDAHARRAAMHLGEKGGMGFKMQWKNGFWAGWAKGN